MTFGKRRKMSEKRMSRLNRIREAIRKQQSEYKEQEGKLQLVEKDLTNLIDKIDLDQGSLYSLKSSSYKIYVKAKHILENVERESRKIDKEVKSLNKDFVSKTIDKISDKTNVPSRALEKSVDPVKLAVGTVTSGFASLFWYAGKYAYGVLRNEAEFEEAYKQCHSEVSCLQLQLNNVKSRADVVRIRIEENRKYWQLWGEKLQAVRDDVDVENVLLKNLTTQIEMLRNEVKFLKAKLQDYLYEEVMLSSQLAKYQCEDLPEDLDMSLPVVYAEGGAVEDIGMSEEQMPVWIPRNVENIDEFENENNEDVVDGDGVGDGDGDFNGDGDDDEDEDDEDGGGDYDYDYDDYDLRERFENESENELESLDEENVGSLTSKLSKMIMMSEILRKSVLFLNVQLKTSADANFALETKLAKYQFAGMKKRHSVLLSRSKQHDQIFCIDDGSVKRNEDNLKVINAVETRKFPRRRIAIGIFSLAGTLAAFTIWRRKFT